MPSARPSTADKRKTFRELHKSGCFVIPNPWNVGSARYLQGLGFKALATTSSGHAHSRGLSRRRANHGRGAGALSRACRGDRHSAQRRFRERLCRRSRRGRRERHALHRHRRRRPVDRGLAATIRTPLYDFDAALARVKAARAAIDKAGGDVVFTARTEGFIRGRPDIDETIRRLKAFADAGADCLYSPGIKTREHIEATVKAVGGKAINFLNSGALGFTVSDLAGMGVRRISVGGSLARVAMHAFIKTATRDRQGRQVRRLRRPDHQRRAEQVLRRRPQDVLMARSSHRTAGRPPASIATPAPRPAPVTLQGRYGTVERLDAARHGAALWDGDARPRRASGPICRLGPFADGAAFAAWIAECEQQPGAVFLRRGRCRRPRGRHSRR